MNINCIICSDLFSPQSGIYSTSCGHLFHEVCLLQWIERSKTCPQCRHKETSKSIHKIYINTQHSTGIKDDAVTLQAKIDNVKFQCTLKQKDISTYKEKYNKCRVCNFELQEMIAQLYKRKCDNTAEMKTALEQLKFIKGQIKNKEKIELDIARLEMKINSLRHVKIVIDGCEESVKDIIQENKDPKSLCLLVAVLQRKLADAHRQSKNLFRKLNTNKNDHILLKGQLASMQESNNKMKLHLENYDELVQKSTELKQRIAEYLASDAAKDQELNSTISRAVCESPAPSRPSLNTAFNDDNAMESPTILERVEQIKSSKSPYLPLKQAGCGYGSLLQAKFTVTSKTASIKPASSSDIEKFSLFNKKVTKVNNKPDYEYNGMGGHSKTELLPQPRKSPIKPSLKRPNLSKSLSNSKLRKLGPYKK